MKQRFLLAIAVAMGLLAAFLTKLYLSDMEEGFKKREADLRGRYRPSEAVVFWNDMPQDSLIKKDDMGHSMVPASALRPGAVRVEDYEQLVGKRTVNYVAKGKVVFWSDIEGGEMTLHSGFSGEITKGMRAHSINVGGSASVSGLVRPNDKVDVIGTFVLDSPDRPNEKEQVTLTVLQNVNVLATGRETSRSMSRISADRASSYSMVTLEVTPREVETLVACEQNRGKLTLALRHPEDPNYEEELPTVDFKFIRETLSTLNKTRQQNNSRRSPPATLW